MEFHTIKQAIDHSIDRVTFEASIKDRHNMILYGVELPSAAEMNDYMLNLRIDVQRVLEQSN